MQIRSPVEQGKSRNQANQAKKVVTMQMRNEHMVDFGKLDFVFAQLHLRAFAAIN